MRKPVQTESMVRVFKQVLLSKMATPDHAQPNAAPAAAKPQKPRAASKKKQDR
ncbi:hypothetical protein [Hoeflea phototrophica]|uniref:hypothetical protein n=1 Tax=Hoeflea phototrophica TaxID=244596 RepID=UPI0012EBAB8A|nr:hypothetical protein [Hoeflea phototrophica]